MHEVFGPYVIDRFVGKGGMAEVHRARASSGPLKGRDIAIKRLLPEVEVRKEIVDLFLSEWKLVRQLKHRCIVPVFDAGIVSGRHFFVMDFVNGRNLQQIIVQCAKRNIYLPVGFACFIIHEVAEALHYAHTLKGEDGEPLGLVHCDVTPSNIFISDFGSIFLGDFGVAELNQRRPSEVLGVVGKAPYMAAEQIQQRPITAATDIFALGTIFYELLTNTQAFQGKSAIKIFDRIIRGKVKPPRAIRPDIPEEVEELCMRMLSPRREEPDAKGIGQWLSELTTRHPIRPGSALDVMVEISPLYEHHIGNPMAIASVVRGLFGISRRMGER